MATLITPVPRVARANRQSVGTSAETHEFDFGLTADLAIAILCIEFVVNPTLTPSATFRSLNVTMGVHIETGGLEDSFDGDSNPTEGQTNLDSEVIAEASYYVTGIDDVATEFRAGAGGSWSTAPRWDYLQMLGSALLVAINPTFRVRTNNAVLVANVECAIWYQYVRLSQAELGGILARRR